MGSGSSLDDAAADPRPRAQAGRPWFWMAGGVAACLLAGEALETEAWPGGPWGVHLSVWLLWLALGAPSSPLEAALWTISSLGWLAALDDLSWPLGWAAIARGLAAALSFAWLAAAAARRRAAWWWPLLLAGSAGGGVAWWLAEAWSGAARPVLSPAWLAACPWAVAMDAIRPAAAGGTPPLWLAGTLLYMALGWAAGKGKGRIKP